MSGVAWWVPWALVFCALVFTAGVGVLVVLAVRGVVGLVVAWRRAPLHAAGPEPERLWPLVGDPRAGSMQLAEDDWLFRHERVGPYNDGPAYLDWRELAHEEDWRDQTAHDLNPATLDPGPGVEVTPSSSAPPGPEWLRGPEQPHEKPADTESAGSGHLDELGPRAQAVLDRYERQLGARRWALAV